VHHIGICAADLGAGPEQLARDPTAVEAGPAYREPATAASPSSTREALGTYPEPIKIRVVVFRPRRVNAPAGDR
jgi:hypothetical protein